MAAEIEEVSPIEHDGNGATRVKGFDESTSIRCWTHVRDLNGHRWEYTASVLTTGALSLVVLFNERGFLEGREDSVLLPTVSDISPAVKEILQSILLLVFAALTGFIGFVILKPNLQIASGESEELSTRRKRHSVFGAFLCLLFGNVLAVFNIIGAEKAFDWKKDQGFSYFPVSHYFLVVTFVVAMLLTDFLFFFVVLEQNAIELDRRRELAETEVGLFRKMSQKARKQHFGWKVAIFVENAWDTASLKFVEYSVRIANFSKHRQEKDKNARATVRDHMLQYDRGISNFITGLMRSVCRSYCVQTVVKLKNRTQKFVVEDMSCLWSSIANCTSRARAQSEVSSNRLRAWRGVTDLCAKIGNFIAGIRPFMESKAEELWEGVREDETYTHSAWVKAAVITAIILILYFGVLATSFFTYFVNEKYIPRRNCLMQSNALTDYLLYNSGFQNGSFVLEGMGEELMKEVQKRANDPNPLLKDLVYDCSAMTRTNQTDFPLLAINVFHEALMNSTNATNTTLPSEVFQDSFVGKVVRAWDILIEKMSYTAWIGAVVGFLIGCYSLLSILGQYKRITLAIRAGYFDRLIVDQDKQIGSLDDKHKEVGDLTFGSVDWDTVVRQSPMSSAMFFFGILVSTAVLQLIVFGALIAFLIALVASFGDLYPFLKQFFALLIAFAGSWLLNDVLSQWAIGEGVLQSRYRVLKETWFVLFLFVYTMVHLVLGILFALSRFIMLMISSLVVLNRLDRNLYTYHKSLDQGHRAFVATILLHVAFHAEITQPSENDSNDGENGHNGNDNDHDPDSSSIDPDSSYSNAPLLTSQSLGSHRVLSNVHREGGRKVTQNVIGQGNGHVSHAGTSVLEMSAIGQKGRVQFNEGGEREMDDGISTNDQIHGNVGDVGDVGWDGKCDQKSDQSVIGVPNVSGRFEETGLGPGPPLLQENRSDTQSNRQYRQNWLRNRSISQGRGFGNEPNGLHGTSENLGHKRGGSLSDENAFWAAQQGAGSASTGALNFGGNGREQQGGGVQEFAQFRLGPETRSAPLDGIFDLEQQLGD